MIISPHLGRLILIVCCILSFVLLIIAINDFLFFRIENESILCLFVLYIFSCVFGISGSNFIFGFYTAFAVSIVLFVLNQFELIGGGDVKLVFPLLLFSENNISDFLIGTSVAGLVLSVFFIIFQKRIILLRKKVINFIKRYKTKNKSKFLNIVLLSSRRISIKSISLSCASSALKQEIPYGVALACGSFYVIIEGLLSRC